MSIVKVSGKIFIASPANYATGGPELLHQLAFKLRGLGHDVFMYYIPSNVKDPVHEAYKHFALPFVRDIPDESNSILIFPEVYTRSFSDYSKIDKILWWLSVDNYFLSMHGIQGLINRVLLRFFGSQKYLFLNRRQLSSIHFHLYQSKYAEIFLDSLNIKNRHFLGDYIASSFFEIAQQNSNRDNIVAYNPSKGKAFTKKLIKKSPKMINFVPIVNMTRDQVIELLLRSKVYIDFGFHPGRDRIPREAATLGCCVITSMKGSAAFHEDVPISNSYKFVDSKASIPKIIDMISDCLANYDKHSDDFSAYRHAIACQECDFEADILQVFGRHSA